MNTKKPYVDVYVTEWGNIVVPDDVMNKALSFTKRNRLRDRRTKGNKFIKRWAESVIIKDRK